LSLAIFDLDNTLLRGDSDHAWGEFLVNRGIVDRDYYKSENDRFYQQYQNGGLVIADYLAFALEPLSQHSKQQLDAWHEEFMAEMIEPMRLPQADKLLDKHRQQGDLLLIITATNRFVTEPIAQALGVDHILATDPEFINGRYTGRVAGTPCFQQGKVERLKKWLAEHSQSLDGSYFYSDSHNDLPLLEVVRFPVAVDADEKLNATALDRDWPIISLRNE
jgi:HAD superfamily hydrolase (TIGR01490 family)